MNYTPNYNLKKPAGSDYVDVQDLNDNMDIIDANLFATATLADETATTVANLTTYIPIAEQIIMSAGKYADVPLTAVDWSKWTEVVVFLKLPSTFPTGAFWIFLNDLVGPDSEGHNLESLQQMWCGGWDDRVGEMSFTITGRYTQTPPSFNQTGSWYRIRMFPCKDPTAKFICQAESIGSSLGGSFTVTFANTTKIRIGHHYNPTNMQGIEIKIMGVK